MEIERTLQYRFEFTSSTYGPIMVTLLATGDDPSSEPVPRIMQEVEQKIDTWLQDELLPHISSFVGQMAIFRDAKDPLERTARVGGSGYTITCQLKLKNVVNFPLDPDEDLQLRALVWKLLGKNDRHARQEMLLETRAAT